MFSEHDIDRELKAALSVSPSPDFEARVRQRIDERRAASRRWTWSWTWAAAAAVVVIAAVFVGRDFLVGRDGLVGRDFSRGTQTPVAAAAQIAEKIAPPSPVVSGFSRTEDVASGFSRTERGMVSAARRTRTPSHRNEPQVLVPPHQMDAIRQLTHAIAERRIEAPGEPSSTIAGVPSELAVEPLVVAPIPDPATEPGGANKPPMRGL